MKYRCPYCKTIIGPELQSSCPQCGKAMKIPAKFQQTSARKRKRAKQRIAREGERKKQESALNTSNNPLRKPSVTLTLLMIMAVVGALLVGRSNKPKSAKRNPISRAILELRALHIASERFFYDCARYPTDEEYLKELVLNPGIRSWRGPYVNIIKPDPWHNKYIYIVSNNSFKVFSSGPDGIAGNGDDIYPYEK